MARTTDDPKGHNTSVRLGDPDHALLKAIAKRFRLSLSDALRYCIRKVGKGIK